MFDRRTEKLNLRSAVNLFAVKFAPENKIGIHKSRRAVWELKIKFHVSRVPEFFEALSRSFLRDRIFEKHKKMGNIIY